MNFRDLANNSKTLSVENIQVTLCTSERCCSETSCIILWFVSHKYFDVSEHARMLCCAKISNVFHFTFFLSSF